MVQIGLVLRKTVARFCTSFNMPWRGILTFATQSEAFGISVAQIEVVDIVAGPAYPYLILAGRQS